MEQKSLDRLKGFLSHCHVSKGVAYTHTTKECPNLDNGSYNIQKEKEGEWINVVCDAVYAGNYLSIAEKPNPYGPLRADFDFTTEKRIGLDRQYTEKQIRDIVNIYQQEIKKIVDEESFIDDILICIVLEKESPRYENDGNIKDGFHLHFPFFICDEKTQDHYLRSKVIDRMIKENIWKGTFYSNSVDKFIDQGIATKVWMMYGSMNYKSSESTPYSINRKQKNVKHDPWKDVKKEWGHVYDADLEEIDIAEVFKDEMIGRSHNIKYYLPLFLSIRGHIEGTNLTVDAEQKIASIGTKKKYKPKRGERIQLRTEESILADIKTIKDGKFMELLNPERSDNRDSWMEVGWVLYCISAGRDEGLNMWIDFSMLSTKFEYGRCEEEWGKMTLGKLNLGSLINMVKEDNPAQYKAYRNTNTIYLIHESLMDPRPNEYDVVQVIMSLRGDQFKCSDIKSNMWYVFKDHRWREMDSGIELKKMLVEEVLQKYRDYHSIIASSDGDKNKADEEMKRLAKMVHELKTSNFGRRVLEMCMTKMHDDTFDRKKNKNPTLIGCENGVVDLDMGVFRDGCPEDYVTMSTGLYYFDYKKDDDDYIMMEDNLEKWFTNKNIREYFINAAAMSLHGGNLHKRIYMCTGPHDGGKTGIFKLLQKVFGEYMGKFPRELFIVGNNIPSNSHRTELLHMDCRRIMSTQELTENERLNVGLLKELSSGGDDVSGRGAYGKKQVEVTPDATLWFQNNNPPKAQAEDDALWSRFRIIDCNSTFVKPCDLKKKPVPKTKEEQISKRTFKADPDFKKKLPVLAPAFLCMLFRRYLELKEKNFEFDEPKEVLMATKRYREENDVYGEFIQATIGKVVLSEDITSLEEDEINSENTNFKKMRKTEYIGVDSIEDIESSYITMADLYFEFKEWYKRNYPAYSRNMPTSPNVKKEIAKRLGTIKDEVKIKSGEKEKKKKKLALYGVNSKNRWMGYRKLEDASNPFGGQSKKMLDDTH